MRGYFYVNADGVGATSLLHVRHPLSQLIAQWTIKPRILHKVWVCLSTWAYVWHKRAFAADASDLPPKSAYGRKHKRPFPRLQNSTTKRLCVGYSVHSQASCARLRPPKAIYKAPCRCCPMICSHKQFQVRSGGGKGVTPCEPNESWRQCGCKIATVCLATVWL